MEGCGPVTRQFSWAIQVGFPPSLIARRFRSSTQPLQPQRRLSSQITKFRSEVEIVTGAIATPGDVLARLASMVQTRPSQLRAALFRPYGRSATTETTSQPKSGGPPIIVQIVPTGVSAGTFAYQRTGKQWAQPIGCNYALFGRHVLSRTENIEIRPRS
jgi:hypothetical protein